MIKKRKLSNLVISLFIVVLLISTTFESSIQLASSEGTQGEEQQDLEKLIFDDKYGGQYFSNKANLNKDKILGQYYLNNKYGSAFYLLKDDDIVYNYQKDLLENGKFSVFVKNFSQDSLLFYKDKSIALNLNNISGSGIIYKLNYSQSNVFILKNNFRNLDYVQIYFQDDNSSLKFTEKEISVIGKATINLFFKDKKRIYVETQEFFKIDSNFNIDSTESYFLFYPDYGIDGSIYSFQPIHEILGNFKINFKDSNLAGMKSISLSPSKNFNGSEVYRNFKYGLVVNLKNQTQNIFFASEYSPGSGIFLFSDKIAAIGKFSLDYRPLGLLLDSESNGKVTLYQQMAIIEGKVTVDGNEFNFAPTSERTKFSYNKDKRSFDISLDKSKAKLIVKITTVKDFSDQSFMEEGLPSNKVKDIFSLPIEIVNGLSGYTYSVDEKVVTKLYERYKEYTSVQIPFFSISFGDKILNINSNIDLLLNGSEKSKTTQSTTGKVISIIGKIVQSDQSVDQGSSPDYSISSPSQVDDFIGEINPQILIDDVQKQKLEVFVSAIQNARWSEAAAVVQYFNSDTTKQKNMDIYQRLKDNDRLLIENLESRNFELPFFTNLRKSIDLQKTSKNTGDAYLNIQKEFAENGLDYNVVPIKVESCKESYVLLNRFEVVKSDMATKQISEILGVSEYELYKLNDDRLGTTCKFDVSNGIVERDLSGGLVPCTVKSGVYLIISDTGKTINAKAQFAESFRAAVYSSRYLSLAYGLNNLNETLRKKAESINSRADQDRAAFKFRDLIRSNKIDEKILDGKTYEAAKILSSYSNKELVAAYLNEKINSYEINLKRWYGPTSFMLSEFNGEATILPNNNGGYDKSDPFYFTDQGIASWNPLIQLLLDSNPETKNHFEQQKISLLKESLNLTDEKTGQSSLSDKDAINFLRLNSILSEYKKLSENPVTSGRVESVRPEQINSWVLEMEEIYFNAYKNTHHLTSGVIKSPITGQKLDFSKEYGQISRERDTKEAVKFCLKVVAIIAIAVVTGYLGGATTQLLGGGTMAGVCGYAVTVISFDLLNKLANAAIDSWIDHEAFMDNLKIEYHIDSSGHINILQNLADIGFTAIMFGALEGTTKLFAKLNLQPGLSTSAIKFATEVGVFNVLGVGESAFGIWFFDEKLEDEKLEEIRGLLSPDNLAKMTLENTKFLIGMRVASSSFKGLVDSYRAKKALKKFIEEFPVEQRQKVGELEGVERQLKDATEQLAKEVTSSEPITPVREKRVISLTEQVASLNDKADKIRKDLGLTNAAAVAPKTVTPQALNVQQEFERKYSLEGHPAGLPFFFYDSSKSKIITIPEIEAYFEGKYKVFAKDKSGHFALVDGFSVVLVLAPKGSTSFIEFGAKTAKVYSAQIVKVKPEKSSDQEPSQSSQSTPPATQPVRNTAPYEISLASLDGRPKPPTPVFIPERKEAGIRAFIDASPTPEIRQIRERAFQALRKISFSEFTFQLKRVVAGTNGLNAKYLSTGEEYGVIVGFHAEKSNRWVYGLAAKDLARPGYEIWDTSRDTNANNRALYTLFEKGVRLFVVFDDISYSGLQLSEHAGSVQNAYLEWIKNTGRNAALEEPPQVVVVAPFMTKKSMETISSEVSNIQEDRKIKIDYLYGEQIPTMLDLFTTDELVEAFNRVTRSGQTPIFADWKVADGLSFFNPFDNNQFLTLTHDQSASFCPYKPNNTPGAKEYVKAVTKEMYDFIGH